LRSNLKEESPFTPLLLKAFPITLKLKPHLLKSKLLIRARESLVSLLRGWKKRNVLIVIILSIFKLIVLIEMYLLSKRWKRFKLLRKNQVKKMMKMMVLPCWPPMLEKCC